MTFGANHYVPVLKLKRAEKKALELVSPTVLAHATPLLEVVENKSGKTIGKHLDTGFKDLPRAVHGTGRYFIDTREIATAGSAAAADAFARAASIGHPFTPVTGIARVADVAAAIASAADGVAVRITRTEFESGVVPIRLPAFMGEHGLDYAHTDLFIDLGPVEDMVVLGITRLSSQFLAAIPDPHRWRTLTLLASAFPMGLKNVARNSHAFADRSEWLSWRNSLHAARNGLARLPTFGDGAIQHPRGVEGFDPRFMPMSASIRYTLPEKWLLIKGESNAVTPLKTQFPLLAAKLTSGSLAAHFAGVGHCRGCLDASRAAGGASGLGSPEAWRRLGTVHHITTAVQQIRALAWP